MTRGEPMRATVLKQRHADHGARFVDFFGWEMPVQYEGILEETRRVRGHVGLFDLCHMGRLVIEGPDREALVEHVFSGRFSKLKHGRAKYGFLLNDEGYPIDDVLVYRDVDCVHIVINATGRDKDGPWVEAKRDAAGLDATVRDVSDEQAMIALQGPHSEHVLQPLCNTDLSALRYYGFTTVSVGGQQTLIARTGYTGEDGFELFFDPAHAVAMWDALLASGKSLDIAPIGLGARDLLRLEAGMPLYGNEINLEIDPLEADLGFGVDKSKADTVGITPLLARHADGAARKAVSLKATGGRPIRAGYTVHQGDAQVGIVTSGGVSPTLDCHIARALVTAEAADSGGPLDIEVRGRRYPMDIVPAPFYKRSK